MQPVRLLDINQCSETDLLSLKGIGVRIRDGIVKARGNSPLLSADDLCARVRGVGQKSWSAICGKNNIEFTFHAPHKQKTPLPVQLQQAEPECVICYHTLLNGWRTETMKCYHTFHLRCINEWFEDKNTCPVCRRRNVRLRIGVDTAPPKVLSKLRLLEDVG